MAALGCACLEVADRRHRERVVVVAEGVRADDGTVDAAVPALPDPAEAVDEEVVADVGPAAGLRVVRVDAAQDRRAPGPRCSRWRSPCGARTRRAPRRSAARTCRASARRRPTARGSRSSAWRSPTPRQRSPCRPVPSVRWRRSVAGSGRSVPVVPSVLSAEVEVAGVDRGLLDGGGGLVAGVHQGDRHAGRGRRRTRSAPGPARRRRGRRTPGRCRAWRRCPRCCWGRGRARGGRAPSSSPTRWRRAGAHGDRDRLRRGRARRVPR